MHVQYVQLFEHTVTIKQCTHLLLGRNTAKRESRYYYTSIRLTRSVRHDFLLQVYRNLKSDPPRWPHLWKVSLQVSHSERALAHSSTAHHTQGQLPLTTRPRGWVIASSHSRVRKWSTSFIVTRTHGCFLLSCFSQPYNEPRPPF